VTRFTNLRIVAELLLPAGGNAEMAQRLLEKSEHECLVTNSLNVPIELDARAIVSK